MRWHQNDSEHRDESFGVPKANAERSKEFRARLEDERQNGQGVHGASEWSVLVCFACVSTLTAILSATNASATNKKLSGRPGAARRVRTVFSGVLAGLFFSIHKPSISAEKRFTVDQHVNREKHKRILQAGERKKQQMLLGQCTSANSANSLFYEELCQAFVSANISFQKLNNNVFRDFLQKYTGQSIPDESTIRKNYIESCYNKTIDAIRAKLDGKKI
ncbi:hypothetical protein ANN_19255 [Periplaneta americana]|uniref:Uncharacterized protein n=1 Tax=Periplaneta americana TaxID=6978 RepID=A0ABQ8SAB1_PERAM|nr:hypothetical protein ANN_19255 [Periplaneta americana]